jgi:hypothetical protein
MKHKILLLVLASLVVDAAVAEEAKVTPLLSKELKESPGKEGSMLLVEYPPAMPIQSTATMRMDSFTSWKVLC